MKKTTLNTYSKYIILNKILNVIFILFLSSIYIIINILLIGYRNINIDLLLGLLALSSFATFLYLDDYSKVANYIFKFLIFLIIIFIYPVIEKDYTEADLNTIYIISIPTIVLFIESIKWDTFTVYFLGIIDFFQGLYDKKRVHKTISDKDTSIVSFNDNTNYQNILLTKRDIIMDKLYHEYSIDMKKYKEDLSIIEEDLNKELDKLKEVETKLNNNKSRLKEDNTPFEIYYLEEEQKKILSLLEEKRLSYKNIYNKYSYLNNMISLYINSSKECFNKVNKDFNIRRNNYINIVIKDMKPSIKLKLNKPYKEYIYDIKGGF